ncbi:Xaa-Pro peptidase family protein [Cupriavidus basilensis]|uniref:Xaa-Pro peptidase family protein n=1 Tax=Cupriavidus basilensis TaxID=68895 RepID=A0ABT6B048_9BURK|nr:Xaa-Pro peptidase family protein [Cupriavidus basilensis]MDF3838260.1 Xaa-Pro peptidase family protein [Cupriavidus basilensis]
MTVTHTLDELQKSTEGLSALCRQKFFGAAKELDAVITTDPAHVGYLSGYRSILQDVTLYAQAVIATPERLVLVTGASDAPAALERLSEPSAIWRYGLFYVSSAPGAKGYEEMPQHSASFSDALSAALCTFDMRGLRVGMDVRNASTAHGIQQSLSGASFVDPASAFRTSRATKLPGELHLMRHASRITDEAICGILPMIRPGTTELEIASEISRHMVRHGGIARFVVVTSGERSSRVDAYARHKVLQDGDLVRLDIGCTVEGYCSDMARTLCVGMPTDVQDSRYAALLAGEQAELAALRPGILAKDVYDIAMRTVRQGALPNYQRNHCGHGIGLHSHEFPLIGPESQTVLEPGMVFCVETPYYEIGWGGMMVEDTAIITDTGHELLTSSARALHQPSAIHP